EAVVAHAAGDENLEGHAVARLHAPALRGTLADLLDHPEWFVARDQRIHLRPAEVAAVGLHVAATDPARLKAQEPVVGADLRAGEGAQLERPGSRLDSCAHVLGHLGAPSITVVTPSSGTTGTGPAFSSGGV